MSAFFWTTQLFLGLSVQNCSWNWPSIVLGAHVELCITEPDFFLEKYPFGKNQKLLKNDPNI